MSVLEPSPVRAHGEFRTLWLVLVATAFGFLFFRLGSEVLDGETQAFDEYVLRALRRADDPDRLIGPAWGERVALDLTTLGGPPVIVLGVVLTLGYLFAARRRVAAFTVLASSIGAFALEATLKGLYDRARPVVVPPLAHASSASFPSGHATLAAGVYLTVAALLARESSSPRARRYVMFAGVTVTLLVGLTRVVLGVHYPSDVLAGWALGSAWALLCASAARRWGRSKPSSGIEAERGDGSDASTGG